jgi:TetR/AcrR family transcriptional regulator, cholesterol catabolism regulator
MEPKERILVKADELFNRYGIRSVSMDDIANGLGMSKKTLYQYYADKEELVNAVFETLIQENRKRCNCDKDESENSIHEFFLALDMMQEMLSKMNPMLLYDMQKYHPQVYSKFLTHKNDFIFQMVRSNLEKGIKDELYRADIDVDVVAKFRIESVFLAFNSDVFPNNRTHLVHIEQQLADIFLYGMVTPKGQKLVQKYKKQRTRN